MIKYRGYAAVCDTLEELLEAIKQLPETIEYINVQKSLQHFQPPSTTLQWSEDLSTNCLNIITEALKEQDDFGYVNKFYLNSYYGEGLREHPYYINLVSDESSKFVEKMSSGSFGKLD